MKTKQAGGTQENPTEFTQIYKDTLEQIFSNLDLDISKRIKGDASGVLVQAFSQENTTVFYEHEVLLQAVFTEFALNRNNTYIELGKEDFVNMLKEAAILKLPKVKEEASPDKPRRGGKKPAEKKEEKKEEV